MIDGFDQRWAQPRPASLLSRAIRTAADMEGFMFQDITPSALENETRFAAERSLRTSFIALSSINAVVAAATAVGIFLDCYLHARRRDAGFSLKSSLLTIVGPKETFPYILSLGIAIQGIIFAAAQSLGLGAILTLGCTQTSQMMLPALFIVPYIQLVFGSETTIRALASQPFRRSSKWALPVCLAVVISALIATYVVARVTAAPNFCFAELLWLVQRWALGSFALLTVIAGIMLIGSIIICTRLYTSLNISDAQRTAASWTACYTILAFIITSVMLPFLWSLHFDDTGEVMRYQTRLSMAATIVINLSGFLTGGLYILLRCAKLGKLCRAGYFEHDGQTTATGDRLSTPGNSIYTKQLEQPISPVRLEQMRRDLEMGEQMRHEKTSSWPMALTAQAAQPQPSDAIVPIPQIMSPEMAFLGAPPGPSAGLRKDSYSLFPSRQEAPEAKSSYLLSDAANNRDVAMADELLPPGAAWMARHERKSSVESSATVQIALRVSNINDMPPVTFPYEAPADGSYRGTMGLAISTNPFTDDASQYQPSMYEDDDVFDFGEALRRQPPPWTSEDKATSDDEMTLSPTVYSPEQPVRKTRQVAAEPWI